MSDVLKSLLIEARDEIIALRRQRDILAAKVEMIDLFALVLHTRPAHRSEGAVIDTAWKLQQEIDRLTEREKAPATLGSET